MEAFGTKTMFGRLILFYSYASCPRPNHSQTRETARSEATGRKMLSHEIGIINRAFRLRVEDNPPLVWDGATKALQRTSGERTLKLTG